MARRLTSLPPHIAADTSLDGMRSSSDTPTSSDQIATHSGRRKQAGPATREGRRGAIAAQHALLTLSSGHGPSASEERGGALTELFLADDDARRLADAPTPVFPSLNASAASFRVYRADLVTVAIDLCARDWITPGFGLRLDLTCRDGPSASDGVILCQSALGSPRIRLTIAAHRCSRSALHRACPDLTELSCLRQSGGPHHCAGCDTKRPLPAQIFAMAEDPRWPANCYGSLRRRHLRARHAGCHVWRDGLPIDCVGPPSGPSPRRDLADRQFGLALLILVLLQALGGAAIHYLPQGHFIRWSHVIAGLIIAGAFWFQARAPCSARVDGADFHGL